MRAIARPGEIGGLALPNRIIRSGTSESMAGPDGAVGAPFAELHRALARGGAALAFTGHLYVEARGRNDPVQAGIHSDAMLPGLRAATDAVHEAGGRVFAQLGHAGSQSVVEGEVPLSPSDVANVMHGRSVRAARPEEIDATLEAYRAAARRAAQAGFDGVHLHGANGYLISQFRSPLTNRRQDEWGGSQEARDRFPLEVIRVLREELPERMPLTMKVGLRDIVDQDGGLDVEASIDGIARFAAAGVDAVEVSSNLMSDYTSGSIRPYIAVDRRRAAGDLLVHRLGKREEPEAYFLPEARALRARLPVPIVLVGGLRRAATMDAILAAGRADFVSLARPLIRQPDLPNRLLAGTPIGDCVSCNICLMHDGRHALRCWRTPRRRLLHHAFLRLTGQLRR
jgi:2,4-dienoyl-CoA reductase-like NADH-dependent reductase (Old Yellow Enzyme family)